MKEGWKRVSLGEIATDMYRGSGIKRDQVTPDGCPCVRYGEIYTSYNISFDKCLSHTDENIISPKKYFENGDILFAITGESVEEIGKSIAYLGNEKCLCGGDIVVMKHNQDPKCLSYALATQDAIKQKGFGKTKLKVVHTSVPSLKSIKVNLPQSLSEQHRIVSYLDTSFAQIDALAKQAEESLENAKALFQATLKELMEKKEGWEEKKLGEIVDEGSSISYGIVQPGEGVEDGIPVVRPVDLTVKIIEDISNLKKTTKDISDSYKRTILNGKEILMCVRGTTGVVSFTSKSLIGCNVTRGLVPLKIKDDTLRSFVYYAIKAPKASDFIQHFTKGAALKQINIADVKLIPISLPPLSEQHSIVQTLDTLSQHISQLQSNYTQTLANCQALKQALLRETFE